MTDEELPEDGLLVIDAIYDALDRDDPGLALALARETLARAEEGDPVIRFLAGVALLELDRPREAAEELRAASELDADDAEIRATLARALFRCCRFAEAAAEARSAVEADERIPDAHFIHGLLLERAGDDATAGRHFRRAAELDGERFPLPQALSRREFERQIVAAVERLPETFRRHLDRVAVQVEELPSDDLLLDEDPPLDPENLLGLFVGVPLSEQEDFGSPGGELPPQILLFKRNLERMVLDTDELREEIAITLYHELGHYLGLDEDELERIDLG